MITIKTSSWFTPLADDHIRIGISRGVPRFGAIGKGYRIYRKLAPGPWFNSAGDQFAALYQAILDRLDPQQVHDELMRIADGRVAVLVCYEKAPGPPSCHRASVAEWFERTLGLRVPELGFETETEHPLRPPARRATLLP